MSSRRRIRLDLAYDGTDFHGWQMQPGRRTVQGLLEQTLGRLQGGAPVRVRGAGRTDAGVHARGQVADAEIELKADDRRLLHSLRAMLPPDLRPLDLRTVEPDFHARYRAVGKTYAYSLDLTPGGDPFRARYALRHPHELDIPRLREALELLPGRRDWSGFAASSCEVEDRVRQLVEASLRRSGAEAAVFVFSADGFLTHMVRNLVGTLLEIGRGRYEPAHVLRIVETGDRRLAGPTAPAHGLCLERVHYDDASAGLV